jgi:hypothetical protein
MDQEVECLLCQHKALSSNPNPTKKQINLKKTKAGQSQAPVAHACNPSYSESRDQEDRGS